MDIDALYAPATEAPSLRVERFLDRSPSQVWRALFEPANAARVWFGSTLETDLRPGGFLRWTGTWEGRDFEDRAIVVACESGTFLDALYFSGMSGLSESPATRLRLVVRLAAEGAGCRVVVEQENFPDAARRDHSIEGWNGILDTVAGRVENALRT